MLRLEEEKLKKIKSLKVSQILLFFKPVNHNCCVKINLECPRSFLHKLTQETENHNETHYQSPVII